MSPPKVVGMVRVLLWTGVLASAALCLLLLATHAEVVQGQAWDATSSALIVVALLLGILLRDTAVCGRILDALVRPRSLVLVSLIAFAVLAVGAFLVFKTMPTSPDEQAHLFQARLFAQFKVVVSYPPDLVDRIVALGYHNNLILVAQDGRAMSVYWPGWALLMTPFVWIGAPWLLGPAMASLGLYVVGRLTTLLAGVQAAAVAILLAATSGAFIVTGMSMYPAGGYLTLNLVYAWLLLRGGRRDAILAGLVGGLALNLNNPVPHALFALPWLIWLLADPVRRRQIVWMAIGYAPWLAVALGWLLIQSSLHASAPGSTGNFWQGRLPLLINVPTLQVVSMRFWELVRLWMWSAPGLLILAALAWRREIRMSGAWVLGIAFGLTVVLYVLFPAGQLIGWGARYYHSAWGALPILAAILLMRPGAESLRRIVLTAALAGLVLVVPIQLLSAYTVAQTVQAGDERLHSLQVPGADLCFVDYSTFENPSIPIADDPSLAGPLVFISRGAAADQALVDVWFPGARLATTNSSGSCYTRR